MSIHCVLVPSTTVKNFDASPINGKSYVQNKFHKSRHHRKNFMPGTCFLLDGKSTIHSQIVCRNASRVHAVCKTFSHI